MRSAKQRANDRRLGRMAKKRFSKTKRVKRTSKRVSPMARRRRASRRTRVYSRARRTFSRRSGSKITSTIRPYASGIGGGLIAETVLSRVGGGQFAQLGGFGGAYLVGGVKGVIGKLGFDLVSGRGLNIPFFGGQSQSTGGLSV
jgi:hypothetical protein